MPVERGGYAETAVDPRQLDDTENRHPNCAIVTAAYWAFTLTDGALRLLVLLHFHELGDTPVQLAFFSAYSARMKATMSFLSCGSSFSPSTRSKNSTVSSRVSSRSSWR